MKLYRIVETPGMKLTEFFRKEFEPLYSKARKEQKEEQQEPLYDPTRMTEQQQKEIEELKKKYQADTRGKDLPTVYMPKDE